MAIPTGKGDPERIKAQERARKALDMRKNGASFSNIANKLGYADESGARKAIEALLKKTTYEAVDEARKLELEKLNMLEMAIAQMVINGNLSAIDRKLRIMDRRAKLLGLDAPTNVQATVNMPTEFIEWAKEQKIDMTAIFKAIMQEYATDEPDGK